MLLRLQSEKEKTPLFSTLEQLLERVPCLLP